MNLSERIKEFRKTEGLTQEELAQKLFVSRQAVSKWEQSRGYPDLDSLSRLSKLMNVSVGGLLSDEDTKTISVGTSKTVAKTNAVLLVFAVIMAVLLVLMSGFMLFFTSRSQAQKLPKLRGLIGFYIDVDPTDGEISLTEPNPKDIYVYNLSELSSNDNDYYADIFMYNNVIDHSVNTNQHLDSTSFLTVNCTVYIDPNFATEYILYEVLLTGEGLKLNKVRTVEKNILLDSRFPDHIIYTLEDYDYDYLAKKVNVGRRISIGIYSEVNKEVVGLKIKQYDAGKTLIKQETVNLTRLEPPYANFPRVLYDITGFPYVLNEDAAFWELFLIAADGTEELVKYTNRYIIPQSYNDANYVYPLYQTNSFGFTANYCEIKFVVPSSCIFMWAIPYWGILAS